MPAVAKTWHLCPIDRQAAAALAHSAQISEVIAQLLLSRGVTTPSAATTFLDPALSTLHSPQLLPGVTEAARVLVARARARERICIYGDYDVDGTTGTAILFRLFQLMGHEVEFYIPNRLDEGYGLNIAALQSLASSGVRTVVSVDCGIASIAEAAEAKRLGLELIITDHHELLDQLPGADILVHPGLPGSEYPHRGLCGAGVAFKLAWAIAQEFCGSDKVTPSFRELLLDCLGLATMGAIADVMPLREETRTIVRHGLTRLSQKPGIGPKALFEVAGLNPEQPIQAEQIAYRIGPRLNSAGRLECARLVVELLTTRNPDRAKEIATYLEGLNQQRQTLERRVTAQAREMVEERGYHDQPAIVVAGTDWHPGVIGIVASRLVETYGRPSLVIALSDREEGSVGSGRSGGTLPLHEALAACTDVLIGHGGHAAAAGLRVRPDQVDALRERFTAYASEHFVGMPPAPKLILDAEVPLAALTMGLMKELNRLEPYGADNARPRFLATDLMIEGEPRRIGQGERHLSFRVRQGQTTMRAVGFGMGERIDDLLATRGNLALAFTPKINDWQGRQSVEIEVQDFRSADGTLLD